MAKKGSQNKKSKSKSQRRVLDAFQLAEKAENRKTNNDSDYSSDEENYTKNGILNAKRAMGQAEEGSEESEFEDEELDSDEALGSEDELDILNSKFSQTIRDKAKAKKKGEYESDEDEGGYTSIDEDDLMPLSAVWDLDDAEKNAKDLSADENGDDIVLNDNLEESSASEEESESSEEEESSESDEDVFEGFDDSDQNEEEIELKSVRETLAKDTKQAKQKKRLNNFQLEENEFSIPTNGQKLSLADMMASVDSSVVQNAILLDQNDSESNDHRPLAVPLPKRIQERHERKAAYEIQVEEVNKWEDTVKENRRAEVLKFPLNVDEEAPQSTTFDPTTKPMTELETKVNEMLEQSALLDTKKESQFEDLAIAKMSKEEIHKRQNELRLMRELMFREEKKAKRIKKIKSKTFHKIKNKEIRRNQELVEGEESDQEGHDARRAKERMTLKHKNQSQWAKSMIKSGMSKDAANRDELEEMLRQGERLRAKIMDHDEEPAENLSDLEEDDVASDEDNVRSKLGKGVMAMDFMKNAEKKAKQENAKSLQELRDFENGDDRLKDLEEESTSINLERNEGRRVYTPSVNKQKAEMSLLNKETLKEIEIDESKSLVNKLGNKAKAKSKASAENSTEKPIEEEENPWLSTNSKSGSRSNKISGVVDKNSSKLDKARHQLNKKKRSANDMAEDDTAIDMDQTINIVDHLGGSDDEQDQEVNIHMFKQKDLIKEAFAGDDVVNEFEREKKQVAKDEGDKEVDLTLPGWGDWTGTSKKTKRKKIVKKINGVVEVNKRSDRDKKNVIINERVNKKNVKYQSNGVPYPFETMEQYERSLRMPIGQEWTSRETHQRLTMPRVIAKHGSVIDPLKAPFKAPFK